MMHDMAWNSQAVNMCTNVQFLSVVNGSWESQRLIFWTRLCPHHISNIIFIIHVGQLPLHLKNQFPDYIQFAGISCFNNNMCLVGTWAGRFCAQKFSPPHIFDWDLLLFGSRTKNTRSTNTIILLGLMALRWPTQLSDFLFWGWRTCCFDRDDWCSQGAGGLSHTPGVTYSF